MNMTCRRAIRSSAETARGSGRFRSRALRLGAVVCHGRGWRQRSLSPSSTAKTAKGEGTNPLHVYGYGSYGYSLPIGFNSNRLSLLDRGFVFAYAHVRGGGDMGKPWHDAGRLMQETKNTFTDFVAVTEELLKNGLWRSETRFSRGRQCGRIADGRSGESSALTCIARS